MTTDDARKPGRESVSTTVDADSLASIATVEAIADAEDITPIELAEHGIILHEYVDVDALDKLLNGRKEAAALRISFEVDDYLVVIDEEGGISVQH